MSRIAEPIVAALLVNRSLRRLAPLIMVRAAAFMSASMPFWRRSPSPVVTSPSRHWSSASSISVWMRGEIGSDPIVSPIWRLSSMIIEMAVRSRLASARPVRSPSFSVEMAMFWVACSVSCARTE
jgi:hypothetical protein